MNNYEGHKRVRVDGEPNGLPLAYMGAEQAHHHHHHHHHQHQHRPPPSSPYALTSYLPSDASSATHNGHQLSYQAYAGSYNAHYPPADVAFGSYGAGDLSGYAPRTLGYAPPAHQAYASPQPYPTLQQQQSMLYDQQHHQHSLVSHKPPWPPQPVVMQPHAAAEDPPKIKIKTDIFKEAESSSSSSVVVPSRRGIADGGELDERSDALAVRPAPDVKDITLTGGTLMMDPDTIKSRISDSGNSTDSTNKIKFQGFSDSESSSSSEDERKIPNDIYFGTPDMSTYRPKMPIATTPSSAPLTKMTTTPGSTGGMEIKKRGRPKGSCNKPKPVGAMTPMGTPSGVPRPQVGRPRGGGHSGTYITHPIRQFKRDFSGIQFKRRWSDDGLDSSHIPNEVFFGDVPVSTEVLFNYYDANSGRDSIHGHKAGHTSRNVPLVNSSDDSSDSDSSDTDNQPLDGSMKRGPGRPRGSKTVNRRSEGQRVSSEGNSPGDKPPGITEMKRFLKIAGIEYDYAKLIEGCISNKERVAALLGLLEAKGLKGPPTVESCRALYSGPPPRRRGPKPGSKRTPKTNTPASPEDLPASPKLTPAVSIDEDSRRVTRGQTSGKPRQRIVISSDEEDAHTPLSKLRTMR